MDDDVLELEKAEAVSKVATAVRGALSVLTVREVMTAVAVPYWTFGNGSLVSARMREVAEQIKGTGGQLYQEYGV